MTASDAVVEGLIDWGVEVVFGLPGDGINGFMEALRKAKDRIRYVHMRHEEPPRRRPAVMRNFPASWAFVFRPLPQALFTC